MARIFISHSSSDNEQAIALRDWLVDNGWDDVFLDLDPERGITAGERWEDALRQAAHQCEAVLALISPNWLRSKWCAPELNTARLLGKKIFVLLIGSDAAEIPGDLTDVQYVDLVNDPDAHTRLKEGLKRAGLDPTTFPFAEGRRPYPGFPPLEEEDAAIFFGRDAQIVRGLDQLRRLVRAGVERVLFVIGASGSGKSSFLRAGLLPRLKRDDTAWLPLPTIRPGGAAITGKSGLVESLHNVINDTRFKDRLAKDIPRSRGGIRPLVMANEDGLARILDALRDAGRSALSSGAAMPPPTIVIPVDQGEELFSEEGSDEAERFIAILASTVETDRRVLVVFTMRTDSFPQVQNHPVLSMLAKDTFTLDRMPEGSFRTIIEGPAALVKPPLTIDPELTEALLEDASGQDALALLAFTLRHLYDEYNEENALTLDGYEALGRLKGVIEKTVEDAFAEGGLPKDKDEQRALIRKAFIPHLARVNAADQFVRRVATRAEIPAEARPLIDRLAEVRLLVKDRRGIGGDGNAEQGTSGGQGDGEDTEVIEVAHEALLREWGDLNEALESEKDFLKDKAQIEQDLTEWQNVSDDAKPGALLTGNKLIRAQDWLVKHPEGITADEREFIQAGVDAETARRNNQLKQLRKSRNLAAAAAVIFIVLGFASTVAGLWAFSERNRAEAERDRAETALAIVEARQLLSRAERLRETRPGESLRAATLGLDRLARLDAPTTDADRAVRRSLAALPKWQEFDVPNLLESMQAPTFSEDRRQVIFHSGSGELQVWDTVDVKRLAVCKTDLSAGSHVAAIAFAPNGQIITQIYDSQPGELTHRLQRRSMDDCRVLSEVGVTYDESARMRDLTVSPGGRVLVSLDTGLHVWDGPDRPLRPLAEGVRGLHFVLAPEGTRVARRETREGSEDEWLRIRDIETGEVLAETLMPGRFKIIDWTDAGLRVEIDKRHYRYSEDLRQIGEIDPAFRHEIESGDGRYYAELGLNGVVTVFRNGSNEKVAEADRRANFKGAAFRPDDRSLFLAGSYGVKLGIWHFAASEAYAHVPVAGQPSWIGFSADGARLLARDDVGEAAWSLPDAGTWATPVAEKRTLDPDAPPIRPPFPLPTTVEDTDGEVVLAEATLPGGPRAVLVGGKSLRGGRARRLEIWQDGTKRAEREVRPVLDEDRARLLIPAENGAFVFTGDRDGMKMFDTVTLESVADIFDAGAVHAGARADGAFAVTVDRRNQARIWDLTQKQEVTRFTLAHAPVALELSPDGRWVAALGPDRDIELWALKPADLIAQACIWLKAPCP